MSLEPRGKPHVCFLVGGREGGGSAESMLRLVRGIDRARFEVSAAACGDGPFAERLRGAGLSVTNLGTGWPPALRRNTGESAATRWVGYLRMPWWFLATTLRLRRHVRRGHVLILHTNYNHFHALAALASLRSKVRCVWHWRAPLTGVRASPSTDGPEGTRRSLVRALGVVLLGRILRVAGVRRSWSIANSEATAAGTRPVVPGRLSVIYNGIDCAPVPAPAPGLRAMLGLVAAARIVGMVGSLNRIKGHRYFLETAALVCRRRPEVHFVHIGGETAAGQRDYYDALLAQRRELALEGQVHFLGHRDDAVALSAEFDIAVVCTIPPGEGFGLVIVEAMAQGVPVVATEVGAAREILTDGQTGRLVPPCDPAAMGAAIEALLDDNAVRRNLGATGQRVCRERFDIRQTVRAVEQVYDALLGDP
ncbi:MAG: glycosyltransferase [Planctomycetes bacterium]|nr:glycosyltransferase [Planctomycetota bacterium]